MEVVRASPIAGGRMLIESGSLGRGALDGEVVVVTGAGHGIGVEAARSLLCLGAAVVIAEIDAEAGQDACARLASEWPAADIDFVQTDVGDATSVRHLIDHVSARFGKVDVVINNATYAPYGRRVADESIEAWDRSYAVNLRGPTLLAQACLPEMIARGHGTFVCVSSVGGPFQGAYEVLKAAQVALANILDLELEETGVTCFAIGPGLVPTVTAMTAIRDLAPRLGMDVEQLFEMNRATVLSVEAAGAGFAAAVANAGRYGGQEISSTQALVDAGIDVPEPLIPRQDGVSPDGASNAGLQPHPTPVVSDGQAVGTLCNDVIETLEEQVAGWKDRSFFERQWVVRDFKRTAGMPVERWLEVLRRAHDEAIGGGTATRPPLEKLADYYAHLGDLARGYVKNPAERDAQLAVVAGWKGQVERLMERWTA
jgi:NAD(P)-dependent dehydrogenase (short-subunit alcohol dehydrogenase family)